MHVRSYVCYGAMLPGPPVRSYVCYEAMFNHIFVMSGRLKLWCSRTLTIDLLFKMERRKVHICFIKASEEKIKRSWSLGVHANHNNFKIHWLPMKSCRSIETSLVLSYSRIPAWYLSCLLTARGIPSVFFL